MLRALQEKLQRFGALSFIWAEDPRANYKQFQAGNPESAEYIRKIESFEAIIADAGLVPQLLEVGVVLCKTENLRINFEKLAKTWKDVFAVSLNNRSKLELQNLTNFMNDCLT